MPKVSCGIPRLNLRLLIERHRFPLESPSDANSLEIYGPKTNSSGSISTDANRWPGVLRCGRSATDNLAKT